MLMHAARNRFSRRRFRIKSDAGAALCMELPSTICRRVFFSVSLRVRLYVPVSVCVCLSQTGRHDDVRCDVSFDSFTSHNLISTKHQFQCTCKWRHAQRRTYIWQGIGRIVFTACTFFTYDVLFHFFANFTSLKWTTQIINFRSQKNLSVERIYEIKILWPM